MPPRPDPTESALLDRLRALAIDLDLLIEHLTEHHLCPTATLEVLRQHLSTAAVEAEQAMLARHTLKSPPA